MKIFISHSHKDNKRINKYLLPLKGINGIDLFLAEESIAVGKEFDKEIETEISNCDLFILIHSINSSKSPFVQQEIGIAKGKGKIILPFTLDNFEPKGLIAGVQYIKLNKGDTFIVLREVIKYFPKEIQKEDRAIIAILIGALILLAFSKD